MTRDEILQLEGLGPMASRIRVANDLEWLHDLLSDSPYDHLPYCDVFDDYVREPPSIRSLLAGPDVD